MLFICNRFNIVYRQSKHHENADAMSRLPIPEQNNYFEEIDLVEINLIETLPVTVDELARLTIKDSTIKNLLNGLQSGREVKASDRFNIEQNEFALQQGCLLRGIRVFIPQALRQRVLAEIHSTHFGISRMKNFARSYCW